MTTIGERSGGRIPRRWAYGLAAAGLLGALTLPARSKVPTESKAPATASAQQLLGASPGFYGSLSRLKLGMTKAQARAAAPLIYGAKRTSYDPVLYGLSFHGRRGLDAVLIHFMVPQAGVERGLTSAWGKPLRCDPGTQSPKTVPDGTSEVRDDGYRVEPPRGASSVKASPKAKVAATRRWLNRGGDMQVSLVLEEKGKAQLLKFEPQRALRELDLKPLLGMSVTDAMTRLAAMPGPKGRKNVATTAHPIALAAPFGADTLKLRWSVRQGWIVAATATLDAASCPGAWTSLKRQLAALSGSGVSVVALGHGRWQLKIR